LRVGVVSVSTWPRTGFTLDPETVAEAVFSWPDLHPFVFSYNLFTWNCYAVTSLDAAAVVGDRAEERMATEHKSIAQELFNSYRRKETFRPLENSGTLEEAYAIQDEFQRLLIADGAGDIVGYKIALTSPAMQAFVGLDHPCGGAIFASRVLGSPQIVDLSDFQHLGVECEIAVRLKADLPMLPDGHSPETVAPSVGAVMPAFELVEDRDANYDEIDAFSLIAGNSWNAANILGPAVTNVQELDLPTLRGELRVNGTVIDEGTGADALGNPLAAVAWLADELAGQGKVLQAGMIVMTGSIVTTYFPQPGDRLGFMVDGLGTAELALTLTEPALKAQT